MIDDTGMLIDTGHHPAFPYMNFPAQRGKN